MRKTDQKCLPCGLHSVDPTQRRGTSTEDHRKTRPDYRQVANPDRKKPAEYSMQDDYRVDDL